jgi:hypothetical protein
MEFKLRTGVDSRGRFSRLGGLGAQAGVDDLFTSSGDQPVENKEGESRNPDAVRRAAGLPSEQASRDLGGAWARSGCAAWGGAILWPCPV